MSVSESVSFSLLPYEHLVNKALIEEKLAHGNKLPNFYRRYVDDTFALVPDLSAASDFLSVLNDAHPAIQFTMETAVNNSLPFVGMVITKTDNHLNTSVYRKKDQQRAFTPISELCRQQV